MIGVSRSMKTNLLFLMLFSATLFVSHDAFALAGELKRPGISLSTKHSQETRERIMKVLNREDAKFVGGRFINWFTTMHYAGDAKALSLFMDELAKIPGVVLSVSFVKDRIFDEAPWSVHHEAHGNRFHIRVSMNSDIKMEEIYIPEIRGRDSVGEGNSEK